MRLGHRDRALEAARWFLGHRRPLAWNAFAEVVGREARRPRFVGDIPHTWVGSDFVRAALDLFAYEDEGARPDRRRRRHRPGVADRAPQIRSGAGCRRDRPADVRRHALLPRDARRADGHGRPLGRPSRPAGRPRRRLAARALLRVFHRRGVRASSASRSEPAPAPRRRASSSGRCRLASSLPTSPLPSRGHRHAFCSLRLSRRSRPSRSLPPASSAAMASRPSSPPPGRAPSRSRAPT